jgi:ADP-L-glycero-D-manno-heptose 6-epimerase
MKILVTGGGGFVGRNLTAQLIQDGHEVTITSTGSEPTFSGVKKILYMGLNGIDWNYVKDQDVVVHLMANNDTLCRDSEEMLRANLYGPIELFRCALEEGCKKFVYASSAAVYGSSPPPFKEEETQVKPLNIYGESKAMFDNFAMNFAKENQVSVTGLRYSNVYGPGEEQKDRRMSMIGQLLRKMARDISPVLFEFGEQKRDWVYVKDVVQANILSITQDCKEKTGKIFNIGSGESFSFNEIVKLINETINKNLNISYIPCSFQENFQNYTQCDISKAKKELGFNPEFSLKSGIQEYYRSLIVSC